MCVHINIYLYIHTQTYQYTFPIVIISFDWKENLLKSTNQILARVHYCPLLLSLGRISHGCRISPIVKLCFCSPCSSFSPVKIYIDQAYVNSGCLDTKKFCTADPEWKRATQAFRRSWKKGTEQFGVHSSACVSLYKMTVNTHLMSFLLLSLGRETAEEHDDLHYKTTPTPRSWNWPALVFLN